jgi:hypothetical protein
MADPDVLARAADENRILVTHDRRTMPRHFADFIGRRACPGVIIISQRVSVHRGASVGNIYPMIKRLRFGALNEVKNNVYKQDDKLSFEILKYCYERRTRTSLIVDFVIKASPIVISVVLNLWPAIAKKFTGG